jgi:hypothetical protein
MALRSLSALAKAIDAVKQEAGNFEEYKPLLDALAGVSKQISGDKAESDPGDAERDSDEDEYSFQAAEKRHRQRTAEAVDAKAGGDKSDKADKADEAGEEK